VKAPGREGPLPLVLLLVGLTAALSNPDPALRARVTDQAGDPADSAWFAGWPQRYARLQAWQKTPAPKLEDAAKREVIAWLDREAEYAARHYRNTGTGLGEAFGDYYIDLTLFVAQLKDPRSIAALTKVTDVAGRVATTLAEFGEPAVAPVLAQLENPLLRDSTVFTLGKFVEGSRDGRCHISEAGIRRIRQALLAAVLDTEPAVRRSAAGALKYFGGDAEVIRTLRQVASGDPYVAFFDTRTGERWYPVREAAAAALDEMDKAHVQTH
jgi:HEAT repeat protein